MPDLVASFRPAEAVLQSVAMCRLDAGPHLSRISCPTLGLVGDASRIAVGLMRRAIDPIPGARLELVPDAFDPSNLCRPDAFNRLLAGFLDEIGA